MNNEEKKVENIAIEIHKFYCENYKKNSVKDYKADYLTLDNLTKEYILALARGMWLKEKSEPIREGGGNEH